MKTIPIPPDMLQPDRLKQLNNHLVNTTGCFAFLKTDQVLFSSRPQFWQDAYTIFSIGLYAVYHDYGCKFLRNFFLNDKFRPNTQLILDRYRLHVDTLCWHIRPNLAHGLLHLSGRIKLQHKLAKYYLQDSTQNHSDWPDYINQLTEEQWMKITQRMVKDSNDLYYFLWTWGNEWAKNPNGLSELQEQFVSERDSFAFSFDDRICRPLLLSHGVKPMAVTQYTKSNGQSAPIDLWRQKLIQFYRSGKNRPEDIYNELDRLIQEEVEPHKKSSVDIARQFGF